LGPGKPKGMHGIAKIGVWFRIMALKASFNNMSVIKWRSDLLVEETEVPRENHGPSSSHRQTLSHNVVSRTPRNEQDTN
jgi:hypothetical protein